MKLTPDKFEKFTLVTNPFQTFSSSSSGLTGSINLYSARSTNVKEIETVFSGNLAFVEGPTVVAASADLIQAVTGGATNVFNSAAALLAAVTATTSSVRLGKTLTIKRFEPDTVFSTGSQKKRIAAEILAPFYRTTYPSVDFAFTNYNSLNFFTASSVSPGAAMIYPVSYSGNSAMTYVPTSAFTLDLYVNPRYAVSASQVYKAGTILHVSSTFCLSLVTGSGVDKNGLKTGYRLLLQLSASADIKPSTISLTGSNNSRPTPFNLVFFSEDNSLTWNTWHHVAVRWGTTSTNHGTGTFLIDGVERGQFIVPSASIATQFSGSSGLYVGNYFEGAPSVDQRRFFNQSAAYSEGVTQLSANTSDPSGFTFAHPLNAEIHDVKIYGSYRDITQVLTSSLQGTDDLTDLLFYVPPFFVKESRKRDVLITPVTQSRKSTETSHNADLAFNVAGHELNLENYVREFSRGEYPRLYLMIGSPYTGSTITGGSAKTYLGRSTNIARRNLTVLPCDNGKFVPKFELLRSGTSSTVPLSGSEMSRFTTDVGGLNLRLVSLRNMLPTSSFQSSVSGGLEADVFGANPELPTLAPGSVPAVLQRTRDPSSNDVVFFEISNLYYGRRILPGSIVLRDLKSSGSANTISFTLKDDGKGGLYRHDAATLPAPWASVGTVFYNEGLICVKASTLPYFGSEGFSLAFRGERNIYVNKINIPAPGSQVNSSSNSAFLDVPASLNANEDDETFVYITGINLHDENLNIVARTNLAQPVIKRSSERLMFRLRQDY